MADEGFMAKFQSTLDYVGVKMPAQMLVLASVIGAFAGLFFMWLLVDPVLGLLVAAIIVDLGIGMPFFMADRKVAQIEDKLPDMLHHMSTTLKTGGTVEVALREVSRQDYGPITPGIKKMIRQINEGKTFEQAFANFADETRSELVRKASVIIVAARKAGGGLVETLTAMSDDIRAISRLQRERKSKTVMQFLFIMVAGVMVAPLVFGIVKSVLDILVSASSTAAQAAAGAAMIAQFGFLFKVYLMIESFLCTLGSVLIREGRWQKAIIYIPMGMLAAYVIYSVVAVMFFSMIGGGV